MAAVDCLTFTDLQQAATNLRLAEGSGDIVDQTEKLRSAAEALCDGAMAIIVDAAASPGVRLLFHPDSRALPQDQLAKGRDQLLKALQSGCLRCNGCSPFDPPAGQ